MFELFNESKQKHPIKVWLESEAQLEEVCLRQAQNLSNLPFLHKWVALMPDTHQGYGMPIGGVIALKDVIIPNAVGVDIGCGVVFSETNVPIDALTDDIKEVVISAIMKEIPLGFKHHDKKQYNYALDQHLRLTDFDFKRNKRLFPEIDKAHYQIGTLGGGNHFIELQEDEDGNMAIMIHSGSRNFGKQVQTYYDQKAMEYAKKHGFNNLKKMQLSPLPLKSGTGHDYLHWMNLALLFARENRYKMLSVVQNILKKHIKGIEFGEAINVHHNYAALEDHYGESVYVHRKGAIRAQKGDKGIIPGAMGSYSYIVEGMGNPESFNSCSHGAGRILSRSQAIKTLKLDEVLDDLKLQGVKLGTPKKSKVVDEARFAYKNIDEVMNNQRDLVVPKKKLKTTLVVKG